MLNEKHSMSAATAKAFPSTELLVLLYSGGMLATLLMALAETPNQPLFLSISFIFALVAILLAAFQIED